MLSSGASALLDVTLKAAHNNLVYVFALRQKKVTGLAVQIKTKVCRGI